MSQDPQALLRDVSTPYDYIMSSTEHFLQADKAAQNASGGFSLFGGRAEKHELAAELYTKAAVIR